MRYGQGFWDVVIRFCTDNSRSESPVWGIDKESGLYSWGSVQDNSLSESSV